MLQSRVHIVVMREIRARILVEDVWKAWLNMIKGKCDIRTCLGQSMHSRPLSSLVPQRSISHRNACELSRMEAMVRMVDNVMDSNMY